MTDMGSERKRLELDDLLRAVADDIVKDDPLLVGDPSTPANEFKGLRTSVKRTRSGSAIITVTNGRRTLQRTLTRQEWFAVRNAEEAAGPLIAELNT